MGKTAERLKKIRKAGLALMAIGIVIGGLLIFTTQPRSFEFSLYSGIGTLIFLVGSLMYFGYEVFAKEFWQGKWSPGPGHEYPEDP